jgi:hypothetical protein
MTKAAAMALHPGSLLHAVRTLPTPYLAARALGRLGVGGAWRRRVEFLWARDARVPCKAPDILTRALQDAGLEPAAFARRLAGARVLEIGCGRHIGMAAYAVAAGADRYIGVDPGLSPELLRDPKVVADYLEPALAANRRRVAEHLGNDVPRTLHAADFAEMIDVRRAGAAEALAHLRRLVGAVDAGEVLDLAAAALRVEAPWVALLGDLERRVDEDLDELALAESVAGPVGARPRNGEMKADTSTISPASEP